MGIIEDHENMRALIAEGCRPSPYWRSAQTEKVIETTFASKRELLVGLQYKMRDGNFEILQREKTGDSTWPWWYRARKL